MTQMSHHKRELVRALTLEPCSFCVPFSPDPDSSVILAPHRALVARRTQLARSQAVGWDWPLHDPQLRHVFLGQGYDIMDPGLWAYIGAQLVLSGIPESWTR